MSTAQLFALTAFPALAGLGAASTLLTPLNNGLLSLLGVHGPTDPQLHPRFFTQILNRSNLSLTIQGVRFLGTWMSAWVLILMDSFRATPTSQRDPSRTYVAGFGLGMEIAVVANVMPVWALTNVRHSYAKPTALGSVPKEDAAWLPWSLLLGVAVPTSLMQLFGPSNGAWIILRLFHPVLTLLSHRLLKSLFSSSNSPIQTGTKVGNPASGVSKSETMRLYDIAFWISAVPHVLATAPMAVFYLLPHVFDPALVEIFAPGKLWPAVTPWPAHQSPLKSLHAGISQFLFWDEFVTIGSIVAWALIVNQGAQRRGRENSLIYTVGRTIIQAVLAGPSAAAVCLIREAEYGS